MARRNIKNYNVFDNHTYYVPGVADMFVLLAWLLAGALLGNIVTLAFSSILGPEAGMEYGMRVAYPVMFIPAMIYAGHVSSRNSLVRKGVKLDSNNFGGEHRGWICAAVAMVATLATGFCSDAITSLMPPMPEWLETILESMTNGNVFVNLLCVSIFAPLFEEWLCRGMVLRGLLNHGMKPGWSILVSAVFFAIIHANPWQAIPACILGSLFGYVYYKTGSLKLTMLMHCTNNTFAIICSNIKGFENMTTWTDVLSGADYVITFVCCLIVIALAVWYFWRIPLNSPKGNCDITPKLFD